MCLLISEEQAGKGNEGIYISKQPKEEARGKEGRSSEKKCPKINFTSLRVFSKEEGTHPVKIGILTVG